MSKRRRNVVNLNLGGSDGVARALGGVAGLAGIGLVLLLVAVVWLTMTTTVGSDELGVRQVYFGPGKGVSEELHGPGLHLVIPGYERLHVFPRDLQILDLNDDELAHSDAGGEYPEDYRVAPAIRIQTSEGYQVTVDVAVLYRVVDPYAVVTKVGVGRIYETKIVARRADKILRQTLGRLDAEDFYDDERRIHAAESARELLQEDLASWGIQVWAVLLRDYIYDQRYQEAIEQRKIQDQKVFKNKAEAIAASREAEKDRVLAEGRANIDVEIERGRAEVRKVRADADLYYRQRVAEGDLLVALAEAEGTKLENAALQQAGASNMVGLEMAETLRGTKVIMVDSSRGGVNPLDLDRLITGW
ncbi:MAG TPA: SPFH domain-containing protein [Deltaproteobacteria bacterium]|nr:SPFH domain-containing protein [Deltaproteobacteria bacterium]